MAPFWSPLRSQFATLKSRRGQHRKFLPYVFTEHGALMAAGVLNSRRAIDVSICVVRTFVAMREALETNEDLARRFEELAQTLERRLSGHDRAIAEILATIRALGRPPESQGRPIGFVRPKDG